MPLTYNTEFHAAIAPFLPSRSSAQSRPFRPELATTQTNDTSALHKLVKETGVPVYTIEYRLAPEHPFPAGVEEVYAALKWVHEQGENIGVDPSRIAIKGESAGGNLAAAAALIARDRSLSPPLAKQILSYPMLDDRTALSDDMLDAHRDMRI
ncbi:alpha/beta hydrolase fold-domain-containing protein [Aspergillus navahoensis]